MVDKKLASGVGILAAGGAIFLGLYLSRFTEEEKLKSARFASAPVAVKQTTQPVDWLSKESYNPLDEILQKPKRDQVCYRFTITPSVHSLPSRITGIHEPYYATLDFSFLGDKPDIRAILDLRAVEGWEIGGSPKSGLLQSMAHTGSAPFVVYFMPGAQEVIDRNHSAVPAGTRSLEYFVNRTYNPSLERIQVVEGSELHEALTVGNPANLLPKVQVKRKYRGPSIE